MSNQLQVSGAAKIRSIQGPVVANSGVITALDGDASQYVRGDGTLADFPTSTGGGSSVSYYLNTSVSQGTIGGVAYKQLSKTPISGAGTDVTISANGYVASYITDSNDPALLEVPAGNFNCEFYFSVDSNAHNPYVYAELYKYDGTTFTLLGSSQSVPEYLTNGTTLSPYYFAIPVATAVLTVTDRIAIRIYVNVDTRTVTLHTENNHLCQVVTTFSKGLISLNNLTRQNQFFQTGTSGTDFAISSATATHTFNLPVASATNTGKLSSTDWSTFNNKQATISLTTTGTSGAATLIGATLNIPNYGSALSSYVPYTGATADVDLGSNSIISSFIYGNGVSGIAGAIYLKQTTSVQDASSVYSSISAFGGYSFHCSLNNGTLIRRFRLNAFYLDGTNIRTYTLPNADGTLALTSDLSGYLPLAGGTLTGALNGTSAVFSSTVQASAYRLTGMTGGSGALYWTSDRVTLANYNATGVVNIEANGGTSVATFGGATYNNDFVGTGRFTGALFLGGSSGFPTVGLLNRTSDTTLYMVAAASGFTLTDSSLNTMYNATPTSHTFNISNAAKMTITSAGNVGIGTSSPYTILDIGAATPRIRFWNSSASGQASIRLGGIYASNAYSGTNVNSAASIDFYSDSAWYNGYMTFSTNGTDTTANPATERMRITSGGLVGINTTSALSGYSPVLQATSSTVNTAAVFNITATSSQSMPAVVISKPDSTTSTAQVFVYFLVGSTGGSGQINANGSSQAAFGALSDIRLKENITTIPSQLPNILKLKPCEFDYKDGSGHQIGFIAQEIKEIYPDAVSETKDGFLTVTGWNKTEAYLVKAIQEMNTKLDEQNQTIQNLQEQINILAK